MAKNEQKEITAAAPTPGDETDDPAPEDGREINEVVDQKPRDQ